MRLPCIMAFLTLIAACGPRDEAGSETKWMTGAGPARGHEDITRLAVDKANDALQGLIGQRPYPKIAKGVAGMDTGNMMVRGNYESDFDSPKMRAFHGMAGDVDWHNDGRIQHIHSLRDFEGKNVLSLRRACESIRSTILQAARRGIASYQAGDVEDGRYWLGHATHTIQDSFSPVHTKRSGPGRKEIKEICVYGIEASGICKHADIDLHDRVWKSSFECEWNPNKRDMSCLKSEAQDAVYATEAFLVNAGEAIFAGKALDETLQGYFNCESLPES